MQLTLGPNQSGFTLMQGPHNLCREIGFGAICVPIFDGGLCALNNQAMFVPMYLMLQRKSGKG